jgi:hypothetical protein
MYKYISNVESTVVDYKKSNPVTQITHGSVDVLLDTSGVALSYVSLLFPQNLPDSEFSLIFILLAPTSS